jgi:hypothetical protein
MGETLNGRTRIRRTLDLLLVVALVGAIVLGGWALIRAGGQRDDQVAAILASREEARLSACETGNYDRERFNRLRAGVLSVLDLSEQITRESRELDPETQELLRDYYNRLRAQIPGPAPALDCDHFVATGERRPTYKTPEGS